ncbi:MAG: YebC/PmpR family DNA-binding transcriptional regulator [bacterium]|nr:YebC/PmpR family DNA-binding transcriptional regulator [bacterium]
MSGHSKWSSIKHKKARMDDQRGKVFTRLIKEITTAARQGGGDESANPRLRQAIASAKGENMPLANIERAVKKGTGELPGVSYEEVSYEGYGPGGVALLVDVLTDNKNRTVSEVRHALTKHNGSMGELGSVSWMFETKGQILVTEYDGDEDHLMEIALEAGAEDFSDDDGTYEIITTTEDFLAVKEELDKQEIKYESAEIAKIPKSTVTVEGKDAESVLKLMDAMEDLDDVQNVYSNFDIDVEKLQLDE